MTIETSAAFYDRITLSELSLTTISILLVICLPGALVLGNRIGMGRQRRLAAQGRTVGPAMSDTTQAAFQALLGLLLAFSFGNALTVSQKIKEAIASESAAIGTAFLRADYLPEPGRSELRRALLAYAQTRVVPENEVFGGRGDTRRFLERTLSAQATLWPATRAATTGVEAPIQAFVAGAMNEVIDAHTYRVSSLSVPVTTFTQQMLFFGAIATLFIMGNRTGLMGQALTWRDIAFALFLCAVMYSVVEIRRPREGLIRVDDSVMRTTIHDMELSVMSGP